MEDGYKACPHCAEPILIAAKYCKHCHRELGHRAPIWRWGVYGIIVAALTFWFFYARSQWPQVDRDNEKIAAEMATRRIPGVPDNKQGVAQSQLEPAARAMSSTEIFDTFSGSVVLLENYNENNQLAATGSGFCIRDSLIATNYHVVRGATRLVAKGKNSTTYEASEIESYDPEKDLAIVKFADLHVNQLMLGDPTSLKRGDRVTTIGAPLGITNTITDGMITNLIEIEGVKMIQTSASISHGSSGGPLFDDHGRVIGITSAMKPEGELINFAVSSEYLQRLLDNSAPVELSQFLVQTRIVTPILQGSISIRQGTTVPLEFSVPPNHIAALEGNFNISGGMGNDINWALVRAVPSGGAAQIIPLSRYSGQSAIKQNLPSGKYALVFDNRFSTFSAKTISGSVTLTDFR